MNYVVHWVGGSFLHKKKAFIIPALLKKKHHKKVKYQETIQEELRAIELIRGTRGKTKRLESAESVSFLMSFQMPFHHIFKLAVAACTISAVSQMRLQHCRSFTTRSNGAFKEKK